MSGLSYEALLHSIRTEPFSGSAADDPLQPPPSATGATLGQIFEEGAEGRETPEDLREPPPPLFDLPLARAASGWGAIAGLVLGIVASANAGVGPVSFVIVVGLGTLLGSLAAVAGLIMFAAAVERFGATWATILAAVGIGLGVATLRL